MSLRPCLLLLAVGCSPLGPVPEPAPPNLPRTGAVDLEAVQQLLWALSLIHI